MTTQKFSPAQLKKAERAVVASTALFIAVFAMVGIAIGWEDLKEPLSLVHTQLMLVLFGLSLFNYFLRGFRWHVFGRKLDVRLPLQRLALYYSAGFALVTTPGKVGTALRLWLMNKGHGIPYVRSTPMLFMDNFTDLLAMLILAGLGASAFAGHATSLLIIAGIASALILLLARPALLIKILTWVHTRLGNPKEKLFMSLLGLIQNTQSLFSPKVLSTTVLFSIIGWAAECYAFWFLLQELGQTISLTSATFIFAFATLVGALSMLPGGLGSAEAVMMALLLALGIPTPTALAATAIIRFTTLWFAVIIGFIVLPFALKKVRT